MHDGRELQPAATLATVGFALESAPTKCTDFTDNDQVVSTYYDEMIELIKRSSGADRVLIFDHTIRESGNQARAQPTLTAPSPHRMPHTRTRTHHAPRTTHHAPRTTQHARTRGARVHR